ncbi:MAG TPA: trigger factor [Oscillospiraceae bacterium]|nr:trigger factor [Oscillospiraceae bacterium]
MTLNSSKKIETNMYELEISVDAESLEKACEHVFQHKKNSIQIQGFRKGKAPRRMIEKLYGEGFFFEDAINELYPSALADAVTEAKLEIVDRPEVEILSIDKATGFTFKAICITKPEVEIKDYKGIEATKDAQAVSDEDITKELDRLRDRNGRIVTVEGRAAEMGDTTIIDFEGFLEGTPFDGGKAEKFTLELGSGQFIPGFEEQIVGHNVDEEFDVNVSFPEEYHAEELKGKPVVFKVKLHEIKAKELSALDDEFAKDASEFDTLEEFKADISKKLAEQYEKAAESKVENTIIDAIIEKLEAEIPQAMFDNRVNEMVSDFEQRISQQGMTIENYLAYTGMDMNAFRMVYEEQATKQVKLRLALEKIAELEAIEATEDDLNAEYDRLAEQYKMEASKIKELIPAEDLKTDLCVGKAMDFVKENAKIK